MKTRLSLLAALVLIGLYPASQIHAQALKIKIPISLVDSIYNLSDSTLKRVRTADLTFGVYPTATRCVDFPTVFDSFITQWTITDTGAVQENGYPGDPPDGHRFVWDLSGCPDGKMFFDNLLPYIALTDKDTFKVDIGLDNDAGVYYRPSLHWPSVLGEYFDTCLLIRNFGLGTQSTQADMRTASSFAVPDAQIPPSLTVRYTIYIHGLKTPPGPPATLAAIFPADGDTGIVLNPALSWSIPAQGAYYYGLQVSSNVNFNTFIFNDTLSANPKQLPTLQGGTTYYWRVYVQNQYGASYYQQPAFHFTTLTVSDVKPGNPEKPLRFSLDQNYPNPFNPTTKLSFVLSNSSLVTLRIYDVFGREVITLINKEMTRGSYSTEWNAGNIASGVYYYKLTAGKFVDVKKMVLIR